MSEEDEECGKNVRFKTKHNNVCVRRGGCTERDGGESDRERLSVAGSDLE